MRVVPREDLDKDLLMPYRKLVLQEAYVCGSSTGGYIPAEAYPLKLIHSDDNGYLILLLDEYDDDSTIIANSIDFDFLIEYESGLPKEEKEREDYD